MTYQRVLIRNYKNDLFCIQCKDRLRNGQSKFCIKCEPTFNVMKKVYVERKKKQ